MYGTVSALRESFVVMVLANVMPVSDGLSRLKTGGSAPGCWQLAQRIRIQPPPPPTDVSRRGDARVVLRDVAPMRRVVGIPQLGAIRIVGHRMERQRLDGLPARRVQIGVLHPGDVE